MDSEAVNQIVKAILSLHDGRTWRPETIASILAVAVAAATSLVTFVLGKRQIDSAREIARTNVLAPVRQAWIEQLRLKIARHMSGCVEAFVNQTRQQSENTTTLRYEVIMMLDPDVPEQVNLIASMHDLENAADGSDQKKLDIALGLVGELAHQVLKSDPTSVKPPSSGGLAARIVSRFLSGKS